MKRKARWASKPHLVIIATFTIVLSMMLEPPRAYTCAVEGSESYQPLFSEVTNAFHNAGANTLGPDYPALPQIKTGYPDARVTTATVPCVILKAIGYVESSWRQARGSVPRGSKGATLVSGSCGYGIMQITSGMQSSGALPPEVQQKIAEDYVYNVAWGAKMLVDKWNHAPQWRPAIGNRDPKIAEDWYYAVWSYHYWGWRNNPNNPDFPSVRPAFNGTQSRTDYPYQELVWGFAANPPKIAGSPLWPAVSLTLPPRESIGTEPGWIPTPSPSHESPCLILRVKPSSLQFMVEPGKRSPFQPIEIDITGSGNATWTATTNQGWIKVTPPSGNTVPVTIYVAADAAGLTGGRYSGSVVINAGGATGSPQTVTIDLRVGTIYRLSLPHLFKGG